MTWRTWFSNSYDFAYLTVALIFHEQLILERPATPVPGGIFFAAGFMLILKVTGKTLAEPA